MERWTKSELEGTSDLKFASCILNERRNSLNPYSPLATKLASAARLIEEVDDYSRNGTGLKLSAEEIVHILYRDGYHCAAKLIESMMAKMTADTRQKELLDNCVNYITEVVPRGEAAQTLRHTIGLTDDEIRQYEMGWAIEEDGGGKPDE